MGPTGALMTISTAGGWYYVAPATTTEVTEKHSGLVVTGDTVLTSWTATNASGTESVDLLAKFNIAGVTLTTDFPPLIIPSGLYSVSVRAQTTNGGFCLLRA